MRNTPRQPPHRTHAHYTDRTDRKRDTVAPTAAATVRTRSGRGNSTKRRLRALHLPTEWGEQIQIPVSAVVTQRRQPITTSVQHGLPAWFGGPHERGCCSSLSVLERAVLTVRFTISDLCGFISFSFESIFSDWNKVLWKILNAETYFNLQPLWSQWND